MTRDQGPGTHESGEQLTDDLSADIGQAELASLESVGESLVIQSHQMEDRRVEIVNFDRILDDVVAEIVGASERDAGLDTAARHPDRERARMGVASHAA